MVTDRKLKKILKWTVVTFWLSLFLGLISKKKQRNKNSPDVKVHRNSKKVKLAQKCECCIDSRNVLESETVKGSKFAYE